MKALQRLNTVYFLTGYLGFLTTWILGLIATILARPALGAAADRTKAVLRLVSPHYCFAQGLYDITNTAPGSGVGGWVGGGRRLVAWTEVAVLRACSRGSESGGCGWLFGAQSSLQPMLAVLFASMVTEPVR